MWLYTIYVYIKLKTYNNLWRWSSLSIKHAIFYQSICMISLWTMSVVEYSNIEKYRVWHYPFQTSKYISNEKSEKKN